MEKYMNDAVRTLGALGLAACVAACGPRASVTVQKAEPVVVVQSKVPGVVQGVWEEPMVDVIDVPPGLDPEGHYYRPGHQEIVEIRQGRWKYYDPGTDNE